MPVSVRILLLENDEDDAVLVIEQLRRGGFEPIAHRVETAGQMRAALEREPWDAILADYKLPIFSGLEALTIYSESGLDIPFIVVSGSIGEEQAVEIMRAGAHVCVMKDRIERPGAAVERELREAVNRRERRRADQEVHRLNIELRQKVELLERSNADLEQFAYAASHDLKEPLRTVASYSQLLLRRFASAEDAEAREFVDCIREGVARMHALIDGLLDYSRASHVPAEVAPIDPNEVLEEVMGNYRDTILEREAAVTFDWLPPVRAHHTQLFQIFLNLVGNALKYQRPDVRPQVHIAGAQEGDEVRLWVRDNGLGIRREHQERIFALFRRLHGAELPGIGVGLTLCKRLVERAGGRIWVESQPGAGSTFYFTLPAAARPAAAR